MKQIDVLHLFLLILLFLFLLFLVVDKIWGEEEISYDEKVRKVLKERVERDWSIPPKPNETHEEMLDRWFRAWCNTFQYMTWYGGECISIGSP